jgi:hypothetical protein
VRVVLTVAGVFAGVSVITLLLIGPASSQPPPLLPPRLVEPATTLPRPLARRVAAAAPTPRRRSARPRPRRPRRPPDPFAAHRARGFTSYAMAFPRFDVRLFNARVFRRPAKKPRVVGHVRRGTLIAASPRVHGPGCPGGRWHRIPGGGHVCTSLGFEVSQAPIEFRGPPQRAPDTRRAVPFRYAKVIRQGAPLLRRRPTPREVLQLEEAAAKQVAWPKVVQRHMTGIYILAIDRADRVGDRSFYRTVRGQYVRAEDLEFKKRPRMRGEHLDEKTSLPLAFVISEPRPRYRLQDEELRPAGRWAKHARFSVKQEVTHGGTRYVQDPKGRLVAAAGVAVARRRSRPRDVPRGERWVHVDLAEQTLVAYEGERPVYATLVSSGKKGYRTRPGLFRMGRKFLSTTMDATDPIDGFYRIEEVPWTMYYWRSYALHGAYWHDDFGVPRSHGCTNLAPVDARWLFRWSRPQVPAGWHARLNAKGTWVYMTR